MWSQENKRGLLSFALRCDGTKKDLLHVDGGVSTTGTVGKLRMKGREVFRHAVVNLADVLSEVLSEVGLTSADIDWVVPHQANARILDATARKLGLPAEKIPLPDSSIDTIVMTYTLCTIPEPLQALKEMRRVLKPGGKLLFCEHGVAPDEQVRNTQNRLQPVWGKLAGGCQLNRDIPALLKAGGFQVDEIETMYVPGPKAFTYNYWGQAYSES